MADLIETLARALCREDCGGECDCDVKGWAVYTTAAQAALAALQAAGMTVVPVEPTDAMLRAGNGNTDFILPSGMESSEEAFIDEMRLAYRAMLSASGVKEKEESV